MASSSLTVESKDRLIRVFGGNRSCVRALKKEYENASEEDFLSYHTKCTKEDYKTLQLKLNFNKS